MTRKEWKVAQKAAFDLACLEYRIGCVKEVSKLAPLPEFTNAIMALENYRDGLTNREGLKKVHRKLLARRKTKMMFYGYTALGEIYQGLLKIIYSTLHPQNDIWSCDCQSFVEALYLAAEFVSPPGHAWNWASGAQHEGYEFQRKLYHKIFDAYQAKWEAYQPEMVAA